MYGGQQAGAKPAGRGRETEASDRGWIVPSIRTNHPMVDAVLNQKYQQAVQKGISILLYCNDLSGIPLEASDLVTLLGNLLDNAISASAQTEEKQIWMRLWQEQGVYQLVVRNSCPELPIEHEEQECIFHGFGTGLVSAVYLQLVQNLFTFCTKNATINLEKRIIG